MPKDIKLANYYDARYTRNGTGTTESLTNNVSWSDVGAKNDTNNRAYTAEETTIASLEGQFLIL